MSSFNKEMKAVIEAMKNRGDYDKENYYLFVMNKAENESLTGLMPFNSRFGFLFTGDNPGETRLFRTIAHELGHGAFKLKHNFDDKGTPKRGTPNLMDYLPAGNQATDITKTATLRKYQWDEIISPRLIAFGWSEEWYAEEEKETAYMTLVTKEGKGIGIDLPDYEKKYCFLTPSLVPIWIKDADEIKFLENGTVSGFVIGEIKYTAIVNDINTYFYCYYDYDDFIKLQQDTSKQKIDGIVILQDLNPSKVYSNYLLAQKDDPVFMFTDYTRLGTKCIKIEYFKLIDSPPTNSKISGQFKDIELSENPTTIAKNGKCELLDLINRYNIGNGIGQDFFILFYEGCKENQTQIDKLVNFCRKLNYDEADNCNETKYQITDAFAEKLRKDDIITLESFLDNYYIGYSLGTLVISDIDLWVYLTDDYNSVSKWEYSVAELKLRYKLLQMNDPLAINILKNEAEGKAQALTSEAFVKKYGNASSLVAFILFFQLETDLLDISAGVEVSNRASVLFKQTKTKPFTSGSITNKKILRKIKIKQLDERLESILKNLNTQVKQLDGVKPANNTLTNLSKKLFEENAIKIIPSEGQIKNIVDDIIKNGDNIGNKTEKLSDILYVRNGFSKVDNIKLNGNQGFDGVYIKGTIDNPIEIIINEAKQMNNGAVKLNSANTATRLPAQMSDEWIENVANRLIKTGEVDKIKIGKKILLNQDKIIKVVTAVDKITGKVKILKLSKY